MKKTFSQRVGIEPVRTNFQVDSMDDALRNNLWNCLKIYFWDKVRVNDVNRIVRGNDIHSLLRKIWMFFFKEPLDTLSGIWPKTHEILRDRFFSFDWNRVYDFIEFVACACANKHYENSAEEFTADCNIVLEMEMSAYRFVGTTITRITDEEEIEEINEALQSPMDSVKAQIKRSLELFSDRRSPNYRGSIKESISAVESICRLIANDGKATLGQALKIIENDGKIELHPALKSAFEKLYGYTSDEDGIRHALMNVNDDVNFEDAKFMLVSCSAFVNFLMVKASKAGIQFQGL